MPNAKCLHEPKVMVANGGKHKDGSPVLQCRDCVRSYHRRHNRKKNRYVELFDKQDGLCAFCEQPLADDNTTHLDHNHETGEVRGLVHAGCNVMIGGIENAIALVGMERLMRYVGW